MTDLWMPDCPSTSTAICPTSSVPGWRNTWPTCEACTATLEDLRRVVVRARGLEDREPSTDLWRGIAKRIANDEQEDVVAIESRRPGGLFFSRWQLAAAAVVLMTLTGGTTLVIARRATPDATPLTSVRAPSGTPRVRSASEANRGYDAAVADLERTLQSERGQLDTATIRVVEHNLWVIDQAIAQARQALATDPSSVYLNGHLAEAKQRKLDLLRRVTAIPTVQS